MAIDAREGDERPQEVSVMRKTVIAIISVLALAAPTLVAAQERHSGTVVAVDAAAGTMVIEELTASNGETPRAVRRTVTLGPEVRIALQERTPDGYQAVAMSPADLRPG